MLFLRNLLNDPTADNNSACGRCDNCRGESFSTSITPATAQSMAQQLSKPGVPIPHRKMWPTGSVRRGKIRGTHQGKALGRLNDVTRGPALTTLLRENSYVPTPPWQQDPWLPVIIKVLSSWEWETRPNSIAVMGSNNPERNAMMEAIGAAIAEIGKMSFAGTVKPRGEHPTAQNSVLRVNALNSFFETGSLTVERGSTVLLLTDVVDTGWSSTIVAADVAESYGAEVLTLALATSS